MCGCVRGRVCAWVCVGRRVCVVVCVVVCVCACVFVCGWVFVCGSDITLLTNVFTIHSSFNTFIFIIK